MSDASEFANYYLECMQQGSDENAFCSLIHAEPEVLPVLMIALGKPENKEIRAQIVECIWQHRDSQSIGFLANLLTDPEPAVWNQALDGIVAIGGSKAIRALEVARTRIPRSAAKRAISQEWIDEALEQIRDRLAEHD